MKSNLNGSFVPGQRIMSCPFFEARGSDCKAACANVSAIQQLSYCETEDYDNCPLFLSRLLRNSRPKFRGVLDLALK